MLLLVLCARPARRSYCGGLGAALGILPCAEIHLRVLALGSAFMILSSTLAMLVRTEAAVKEGLIGNVPAPVLILVFGWGAARAAAVGIPANIVATGRYLRYILRRGAAADGRFPPGAAKAVGAVPDCCHQAAQWGQLPAFGLCLHLQQPAALCLRHKRRCRHGRGGQPSGCSCRTPCSACGASPPHTCAPIWRRLPLARGFFRLAAARAVANGQDVL